MTINYHHQIFFRMNNLWIVLLSSILLTSVGCSRVQPSSNLKKSGMGHVTFVMVTIRCEVEAIRRKFDQYTDRQEWLSLQEEIAAKYGYTEEAYEFAQADYLFRGSAALAMKAMQMGASLAQNVDKAPKTEKEWIAYFVEQFKDLSGPGTTRTSQVCDVTWTVKNVGSLDPRWVKARFNSLKVTDRAAGLVEGTVTLENTKAIFFEVNIQYVGPDNTNSVLPAKSNYLLYPQEVVTLPGKFTCKSTCDESGNAKPSELTFNCSRGEFTGCTLQQFLVDHVIETNALIRLLPQNSCTIGYSNKAVYMSTINLLWTALTGEWLKRDFIENGLTTISTILESCDQCSELMAPFGGSLSADFVEAIYTRKVDPGLVVKTLFEIFIVALKNPLIGNEIYTVLAPHLGSLAGGSAAVMATNLTVVLAGGWRLAALTPIAIDVWSTQTVEDYISLKITPSCCPSN